MKRSLFTIFVLTLCIISFAVPAFAAGAGGDPDHSGGGSSNNFQDNSSDSSGTSEDIDSSGLHDFTWKIFLTIRSVCIPLAIVSLASCGYMFLGPIFFGTSDSRTEKARKQFFWTVVAILFIVLLPAIFDYVDTFFKANAWTPN